MTRHRSCAFYIAHFYKIARVQETGWYISTTPDGAPIIEQDAYFWSCLEYICSTLNLMMSAEHQKIGMKK